MKDLLILKNGRIYLERGSFAEAVAVQGERIAAVGSNEDVLALSEADTRFVDCGGRTVIPGLNDSHMHLMQRAESAWRADISGSRSIDELIGRCRDYIARYPDRCKNGLYALGWNQDLFEDGGRMPDRHDLDRISTEIPVVLARICGHVASSNSRLIEMMGLGPDTAIAGGTLVREAGGQLAGIYTEAAANMAAGFIPGPAPEQWPDLIRASMDYGVSRGLTSVQSNDAGTSVPLTEPVFDLYRGIYADEGAKLRFRHQVCFNSYEGLREYLEHGEYAHRGELYRDDMLTLGPLKLFRDGSLGARTALMSRPYADDPQARGVEWMSKEETAAMVRLASAHGLQVVTHCIGDRAVSDMMDCCQQGFMDGRNSLRHALIHCQITDRPMLERIRDLGLLTAVQPVFLDYDMHVVIDRCGRELASTSYAFGTMARLGIHMSFGTDCPVEECDPFMNIYEAVNRRDRKGFPEGGFFPEESVDVATAIDAYTGESAYMEFMEDRLGRIRAGHYADMVMLDRDIFGCDPLEIKDISPVLTMVNGRIVYEA